MDDWWFHGFICISGYIIRSFSRLFISSWCQAVSHIADVPLSNYSLTHIIYVRMGLHMTGETNSALLEKCSTLLMWLHTVLITLMYLEPCDEIVWSWRCFWIWFCTGNNLVDVLLHFLNRIFLQYLCVLNPQKAMHVASSSTLCRTQNMCVHFMPP